MKCYFAHPFKLRFSEEKKEIMEILKDRGIDVLDPFIDEEKINIEYGAKNYYDDAIKNRLKLGQKIWQHDLDRVLKCDMILVWQPHATTGCTVEMWEAFRNHKFIQIIAPNQHPVFAYILKTGRNQQFRRIEEFKKLQKWKW